MAAAASLLFPASAALCLAGRAPRPTSAAAGCSVPIPSPHLSNGSSRGCVLGVGISGGRAPGVRRNAAAETYVPGSGKYIAPDYLVVRCCHTGTHKLSRETRLVALFLGEKKVTAKELEELVRGERKVPLIVDFYATWCGPCVLMAQDMEMVYETCKFTFLCSVCYFSSL
ncbi:hypothetical protein GUJ93_ZPchr0008g11867 [Zizania palustris]|uniref:Thioredoxin domain-containing protein n=1 Tax=Zizania palustris TaxID=103762 RepID=A0A8J5VGW7_ZIZPA|nr:hypothetical protein GUJ93_ZPchr0008g11867 [Zizania palustris]KAG8047075.1 hypothetical protein GUJ93_ZPchr0008g11867 [Zizania palustris]